MTGIELAVGYVFAWAVRKARRVGGRADAEVDRTLDTAMDRLHGVVEAKLGGDTAFKQLTDEAGAGREAPGDRTRRRVCDALEDAAEKDPGFAEALDRVVGEVQTLTGRAAGASAGDGGVAVGGNVYVQPGSGSVGAVTIGSVTMGHPPRPGPQRG